MKNEKDTWQNAYILRDNEDVSLLGITDFATTPLWAGIVMLLIVAALEIPTIYIINHWLPFLAGKRYKKQVIMHN